MMDLVFAGIGGVGVGFFIGMVLVNEIWKSRERELKRAVRLQQEVHRLNN